ncbi:MAG: hypothetical protein RIF33_08485 [Cyclobacteriaceae bacterium]
MSIWLQKISTQLKAENYLFQSAPELPQDKSVFKDICESDEVAEVYAALGGKDDPSKIALAEADFWVGDHYLVIDGALSFHRYRLATFRSPVYQEIKSLDLSSYRRYSRQFEAECIKAGIRANVWTNKQSEQHFGRAADPGDFFANGSPGWKYSAFSDFLLDIYAHKLGLSLIRLPIYANLMLGGRLERLDKLLLKGDEQSGKYVAQHLARLLAK